MWPWSSWPPNRPVRKAEAIRDCTGPAFRWLLALLLLLLEACSLIAADSAAAQPKEPVKIGALTNGWGPTPAMAGLRDGLIALGYQEGEQFVIGVRFSRGDLGALSSAARQLVQAGPDIIFASGTNEAKAAQTATSRIPIVFAEGTGDPVELGLVQSFAKPGGNITGVTDLDLVLNPKRLEIFKQMIPSLKRVMFLYDPSDANALAGARVYRDAARRLGISLVERPVRTTEDARKSLANVRKTEVDGIISSGSMALNIPGLVLNATSERRVPTMFNGAYFVEQGALASYGPDFYESGRQAARLVDKVLKGEKPATIPVEANPKIELVVNLKVAKALKIEIAPVVLQRANRLIE